MLFHAYWEKQLGWLLNILLKKRRINKLKVLYSKADSSNVIDTSDKNSGRHAPGSISYVPSTAGLLIAGEVIKDIINKA